MPQSVLFQVTIMIYNKFHAAKFVMYHDSAAKNIANVNTSFIQGGVLFVIINLGKQKNQTGTLRHNAQKNNIPVTTFDKMYHRSKEKITGNRECPSKSTTGISVLEESN